MGGWGGQRSPCPGGDIEAEMGGGARGDGASVIKKGAGKSIPGCRAGLSEGVRVGVGDMQVKELTLPLEPLGP